MIVRTKGGEYRADNSVTLLDFLGVKINEQLEMSNEQSGKRIAVNTDVELIAAVPFKLAMSNEGLAMKAGESAGTAWYPDIIQT